MVGQVGIRNKFFNLSSDPLCVASISGPFVEVNDSFTQVLGYERDELLAGSLLDLVHPDDLAPTREELKCLEAGFPTTDFETRCRRKDGHYITLNWSAVFEPGSGLFYASARDVTEQVNLRNRLSQFERAIKQESIFLVVEPQGTIVEANDKVCEITSYSREELIGHSFREFLTEYHSPELLREVGRVIGRGDLWSGILKCRSKDEEISAFCLIVPMLNHEELITSYVGLGYDLTANVRNEEALARTVAVLNETSSIAKVGGWELDVATQKLNWTDETFRILEMEKTNGRDTTLREGLKLFTPECQPVIERAISRAMEFGEPYSLELEAKTAKGNVLWVHTNGKANYQDGRIVSLSGIFQDIHARKVAEKRYEAEHRRVVHDEKMALLGKLAASVAHELNNPLGIASGYAELALEAPDLAPKVRQKFERIMRSCERMSHIVGNLKRFSRSDQEPQSHRPHPVVAVVREAIALVDSRLKREQVRLDFHSDSKRKIFCSDIEIEQVLVNLLNNSIDAVRSSSEKRITVELIERAEEVAVRVLDTGPGIPDASVGDMFAPFFSTKSADEGTGLGLSISREILEDHDGTLTYDRGASNTCFVLVLPSPVDANGNR